MFKDKPVISNQYGAFVMAVLPFLYAFIFAEQYKIELILFGFAWIFLYLFSYPFFQLFSKKPSSKNKKWAIIYFLLSIIFALPALFYKPSLFFFIFALFPLGVIQYYYAKKKDERHLINDLAGILIFGIVGVATYYLASGELDFKFLIHPCLFFIATTFYIKSVLRERKNPFYLEISIGSHLLLCFIYLLLADNAIFMAYLFALIRAILIPTTHWKVKQIGIFEFLTITIFFIALISPKIPIG